MKEKLRILEVIFKKLVHIVHSQRSHASLRHKVTEQAVEITRLVTSELSSSEEHMFAAPRASGRFRCDSSPSIHLPPLLSKEKKYVPVSGHWLLCSYLHTMWTNKNLQMPSCKMMQELRPEIDGLYIYD